MCSPPVLAPVLPLSIPAYASPPNLRPDFAPILRVVTLLRLRVCPNHIRPVRS